MEASIDNSPFSLNIQTHMGPGLLFFGQHCNLKKMTIFFFNEDLSLRKIELEFFFSNLLVLQASKASEPYVFPFKYKVPEVPR